MTHCLHCNAETTNGLALCSLCQRRATDALTYLPIYFRNLARWRPGRTPTRQVPGSRVLYQGPQSQGGTGDRISDRLDEAATMLTTRAMAFTDDRPHFTRPLTWPDAVLTGDLPDHIAERLTDDQPAMVAALCAGFDTHLTSIATLDWCGQFVADLARHESTLRTLTETSMPGWYAGACRRCETPTHVVPGLTWVTCPGCGISSAARDHLETILTEARGWVAPPKRIAEALVALLDTEQSVDDLRKRISTWATRHPDRVATLRPHEQAPKRHRLGDVLDELERRAREPQACDSSANLRGVS